MQLKQYQVDHLLNTRGMTIAALMRCKFLLAKKIDNKIADIRQAERSSVYQQYLLVPAAKFQFDLHAICEDLRKQEKTCGHPIASLPPKCIPKEPS